MLKILIALNELEKTFGLGDKINTIEEEKMLELDIKFSLEKLDDLIGILKIAFEGPIGFLIFIIKINVHNFILGEQLIQNRQDFLRNLTFYIWNKYFISQLYQIEHVYELRISEEISEDNFFSYKKIIESAQKIFTEVFFINKKFHYFTKKLIRG